MKKRLKRFAKKIGTKSNRKKLAFLTMVFFASLLVYRFKHFLVVAMVNGRPISRYSLDRELEKRYGSQLLENLVAEVLINQEAARKKMSVSSSEIEAKTKELEEQFSQEGMDLQNLLASQGQTQNDLEKQLRLQLLIEKLLGQEIEINQEELESYYQENKDFLPETSSFDEVKDDLTERLRQEKISEKFQPWLSDLRDQAKIKYFLPF